MIKLAYPGHGIDALSNKNSQAFVAAIATQFIKESVIALFEVGSQDHQMMDIEQRQRQFVPAARIDHSAV